MPSQTHPVGNWVPSTRSIRTVYSTGGYLWFFFIKYAHFEHGREETICMGTSRT